VWLRNGRKPETVAHVSASSGCRHFTGRNPRDDERRLVAWRSEHVAGACDGSGASDFAGAWNVSRRRQPLISSNLLSGPRYGRCGARNCVAQAVRSLLGIGRSFFGRTGHRLLATADRRSRSHPRALARPDSTEDVASRVAFCGASPRSRRIAPPTNSSYVRIRRLP
jgi:hypothetical protein